MLPYEKKLLGITAMQKRLGKSRFDELLTAYIEKPQGKPTLVLESDKRPAMNNAKTDFMEEKKMNKNVKINNSMKVITDPDTRWSYANVWEPKSINGGTPKYSVSLIIPNSEGELAAFALLFEFDGDQKHLRHVLYNCSASRPGIEGKTNEDSKEVQTEKLSLKAVPLANGMVKAKTGNTTDATTYADWYKAVYVPAAESDGATQSASKPAKAIKE